MDKNKAKAYAAIALEALVKFDNKISPEKLSKQMDAMYELYEENEVELYYDKLLEDDKRFNNKKLEGRVNCYIINLFESSNYQRQAIERFCKNSKIDLKKVYIAPTGNNTDRFYELIKDIRAKSFDILIVTVFSIYAISQEEWNIIVKLCRKNNINIIEI